jgi:hypothetical protein
MGLARLWVRGTARIAVWAAVRGLIVRRRRLRLLGVCALGAARRILLSADTAPAHMAVRSALEGALVAVRWVPSVPCVLSR